MKQSTKWMAAVACGMLIAAGAAQAQVREQTLRWTTQNPAGHPITLGGQKFADLVAQKSGGKMQVKLFPGGVLGGDVQVLSAVQGGTIDMTSMNAGILQGQVKEFAIVDFPFLFNDAKEADAILDGPIGKALADKLPEKGLVNLGYWDLGFRNVTDSKHAIKTADDIAGLKIRVIQSPIYIDTFNALGANAVPMPFPEVYTALEQKTIDGQENPFTVIEANKFQEVQKFLAATRHIYNPQAMFISKKTWDRLNKDEQQVLMAAAAEAQTYQRKVSRDAQEVALANLKKTMEYTELPPAELAKIRTKLKPVIDKYSASVGADFAKQVYTEIDKVRGK
jgi:tripartite ATP-independent transporter DctP family solute receptor